MDIKQMIINELSTYDVEYNEEDKEQFMESLMTYCAAFVKGTIVLQVSKFVDEQRNEKLL